MRPDGSVNVVRLGHGFWQSLNLYQHLLTMRWPWFLGSVFGVYVLANVVFALLYVAAGPGAISGGDPGRPWHNAFFFSVQTIATIGYGQMTPQGTVANLLVAVEALTGLMGFALITGLLFARFSRPSALILRSDIAVVAPYGARTGLMFRVANGRTSQLIDVKVIVTYSAVERMADGRVLRRFRQLPLERDQVALLPTQWVIVHPIDEASPFAGGPRRTSWRPTRRCSSPCRHWTRPSRRPCMPASRMRTKRSSTGRSSWTCSGRRGTGC